jgi:hypothetical protein
MTPALCRSHLLEDVPSLLVNVHRGSLVIGWVATSEAGEEALRALEAEILDALTGLCARVAALNR